MLQNFTKIGITDVAFLIVNSKKERSQLMFPKLEARVSFPVYQETSDEAVWNVLGGGKDDMFIYDRCGRLVAYIPFPLSNLGSERSFVLNLMLYAYHKDPCSNETSCDEIDNTSTEDSGNQNYTYFSKDTYDENYEQDNLTTITDEIFAGSFENYTLPDINETINNTNNNTFYQDYDTSVNSSHFKAQHHSIFQSSHNSIWKLSGLSENNTTDTTFSSPVPSLGQNNTICNERGNCKTYRNDVNELQIKSPEVTSEKTEPSQKRICLAEDEKVCGEWSKRQLKSIRKCCTSTHRRNENTCKSFQKKKCKKLRTVIKCCLKLDTPEENDDNMDDIESPEKQKITDSPVSKHHAHANEHHSDSEMQKLP